MLKPRTAHDCDWRPATQWGVDSGQLRLKL